MAEVESPVFPTPSSTFSANHDRLIPHSTSVFENGKLKPKIYKIQNIQSGTYLDVEVHTRDMCYRPAKRLGACDVVLMWGGRTEEIKS